MNRFLCIGLLCAVGCTSVPTTSAPAAALPAAPAAAKEHGIQVWIPNFFADLWESFDARIGMDYGFGAHIKVTDLARVGIFDYSDFTLIGVDKGIFKGDYAFPDMKAWNKNNSWDLSIKVGVGLGAEATLHTWELLDAITTLVTLDYASLNGD